MDRKILALKCCKWKIQFGKTGERKKSMKKHQSINNENLKGVEENDPEILIY